MASSMSLMSGRAAVGSADAVDITLNYERQLRNSLTWEQMKLQ